MQNLKFKLSFAKEIEKYKNSEKTNKKKHSS